MTNQMPLAREPDAAERRMRPVLYVGPYILLGVLTAFTVGEKHSHGGSLRIDMILCALDAVWMLWVFTLHPAWWVRPRVMAVFFTVFVAIMAVLVIRDPWFGFLTPAGYFYAFGVLRWPGRLVGVGAVAVVASTGQAYGVNKDTALGVVIYVAIVAVNVLPLCGLAWFDHRNDQQKDQRELALDEVSEANRRLEATLAENAGLHEQLMIQAREAGILDERQRMAREIHDTLAQGLIGIITQLQAAEQASEDPAGWRRHFGAATRLARESLSEARRSVDALRPEPLERGRLSDAMSDVADQWSARHAIAVQFSTNGAARPLPAESELALLRTEQEGLANVARHAEAARVWVTLSYMEHEVALDVRDDGKGFDPARLGEGAAGHEVGASRNGGGFGLVAMRQRIESLAGTLQIESEPGAGTAISACVQAPPAGAWS